MIAVVANPTAGKGRHAALLPALLDQLGPHELLPPGADALRAAVAGGADAVVAMGGDGTVHAALQAVAGTGVPLGIVPLGTGNDLSAGLGLPGDPRAAVAAILAGRTRAVDLARVDGAHGTSWFGSVLAAGFDALVNERANRMRWPRGPRRYDLAIFAEMARLRPLRYRLVVDGVPEELDSVLLAVGNTVAYGGGMRICPGADPTDGLLDVTLGVAGRLALATLKPKVRTGAHVDHPGVRTLRATTLEIAGPDLHCYADGERIGPLPVTVTCVPGALTLLH
ncbi:diacylglycerol kinase family protein [Longispora fulva]|uniref:Diacylglycerol kinase (ATP) n=1 Tax=Longispora fulva TaxID=619741 RepID=A0A8J7GGW1_9ACTN|nr:diacylglycerol kinase family protein [Longispora fulva]MBG6137335.1 diacylglycerol kinase (ATP) [Longispora fulva]